ncbi:MAG: CAP domain-containing protein [Bacteroidales bacterium]
MFKKIWKRTRMCTIFILIFLFLPHSLLSQVTDDSGAYDLEYYKKLNENEHRLIEFKDTDESLKLKSAQLEIINKSRKKNNASPVRLDILASRMANKMCMEAADNKYIGHWNMAGEEPYLRYAFAGGYDHVSENAYGEWSSDNYKASLIGSLMKTGHEKFMAERSPHDGHKQNIIDKSHNFVGIGFCLSGKQFRYYEEFIDRYLEFENIPAELKTGDRCTITVRTDGRSFLYYLIIYRENWPHHLTPGQISKKGSYLDFTDQIYKDISAWDLRRYRNGADYEIPLSFPEEGLYYIQIFSDKKEITKPASINTKGRTPESGIVIKVIR